MKTYEELNKRGTGYLCGYTDALTDLARAIGVEDPDLYDCETLQLLAYLNEYLGGLLNDQGGVNDAAK